MDKIKINKVNCNYLDFYNALNDLEAKKNQENKKFYICVNKSGKLSALSKQQMESTNSRKLSFFEITQIADKAIDEAPKGTNDNAGSVIEEIKQKVSKVAQERASKTKTWQIVGTIIGLVLGVFPGILFYKVSSAFLHLEADAIRLKLEKQVTKAIKANFQSTKSKFNDEITRAVESLKDYSAKYKQSVKDAILELGKQANEKWLEDGQIPNMAALKKSVEEKVEPLKKEMANKLKEKAKELSVSFAASMKSFNFLGKNLSGDVAKGLAELKKQSKEEEIEKELNKKMNGRLASIDTEMYESLKEDSSKLESMISDGLTEFFHCEVQKRKDILVPLINEMKANKNLIQRIKTLIKENKSPLNDKEIKNLLESYYERVAYYFEISDNIIEDYKYFANDQLNVREGEYAAEIELIEETMKQVGKPISFFEDFKKSFFQKVDKSLGMPPMEHLRNAMRQMWLSLTPEADAISEASHDEVSESLAHFKTAGLGGLITSSTKEVPSELSYLKNSPRGSEKVVVPLHHTPKFDFERGNFGKLNISFADGSSISVDNLDKKTANETAIAEFCDKIRDKINDLKITDNLELKNLIMQRILFIHQQSCTLEVNKLLMNLGLSLDQVSHEEAAETPKSINITIDKDGNLTSKMKLLIYVNKCDLDSEAEPEINTNAKCYQFIEREMTIPLSSLVKEKAENFTENDMNNCKAKFTLSPIFTSLEKAREHYHNQDKLEA